MSRKPLFGLVRPQAARSCGCIPKDEFLLQKNSKMSLTLILQSHKPRLAQAAHIGGSTEQFFEADHVVGCPSG